VEVESAFRFSHVPATIVFDPKPEGAGLASVTLSLNCVPNAGRDIREQTNGKRRGVATCDLHSHALGSRFSASFHFFPLRGAIMEYTVRQSVAPTIWFAAELHVRGR